MTFIGTAGWAIPKLYAGDVPTDRSGLARYATIFSCAEINSSFRHEHRASTYARWADSVPEGFRFAVKLPRFITHERRLQDCRPEIAAFLTTVAAFGEKIGPLLVQLPPSFEFDAAVAAAFFKELGSRSANRLVCEPRHASWFSPRADEMLAVLRVSRVVADPPVTAQTAEPGFNYLRLHGSPRVYYSAYADAELSPVATLLREAAAESWCIFDNTASGAAFGNALQLKSMLAVPQA